MDYREFLDSKAQIANMHGFKPVLMHDFLFDFQRYLVEWALMKGRAAIWADCGLGKTPMQLAWAENVVRHTNSNVLIITPLAVSGQTVREGAKFGIECKQSRDGTIHKGITVTNYEQLHRFDCSQFDGVVCDESSAIKNYEGKRQEVVTEFMRRVKYRLLCTATASPNDFIELGTSAEALGELGRMDMLERFFKNDENSLHPIWWGARWRFKAHAERFFWRWVCSWARACRKPSDLGFDDRKFKLPELIENEHVVKSDTLRTNMLFDMPAVTLQEQREERRLTIDKRCMKVAELVANHPGHSVVWCHLNPEGDMLEKLIPNSRQISGATSDDEREEIIAWFTGEKCTCQLSPKRVKISACQQHQTTLPNTTEKIEIEDSLSLKSMPKQTLQKEEHIPASTTRKTSTNGRDVQKSSKTSTTSKGKSNTKTTNLSELKRGYLLENGKKITQENDLLSDSENTASQSNNTNQCSKNKKMDAEYVKSSQRDGCTLTTAIQPEKSEGCCVTTVILESESSKITQDYCDEQQCTCGHATGKRVLISKPVVMGFGLNLQNANHMTFFPSHSFEQYYQGVRRCWRFGQKKPVTIDIVTSEGESDVMKNLQRKADQADKLFTQLVAEMRNELTIKTQTTFSKKTEVPTWL